MDAIGKNLTNIYTPGFREVKSNFGTFLNGSTLDDLYINMDQGKSMPGTSPENVFLEGSGFFVVKNAENKMVYTRNGEFKFDSEGVYKTKDGKEVQGYILNENGEILGANAASGKDIYSGSAQNGGPEMIPTTAIKLWIDPNNGKYLGKYEEFEIKEDGILYVKADKGKIVTPLYKIAVMNFHNSSGLCETQPGEYLETVASGKPVAGRGEIRSGLIEQSNVSTDDNITYYRMAKMQMDLANKLVSSNKSLLEEVVKLLS
jgi:flagellar hook protein FlgE